jgi:hypothetical protein
MAVDAIRGRAKKLEPNHAIVVLTSINSRVPLSESQPKLRSPRAGDEGST